ncbi:MAG: prephenate dehydratase [Planctomycetes bacterium]|nr:prephenate dehydratase [Planctomycetota bacterium]
MAKGREKGPTGRGPAERRPADGAVTDEAAKNLSRLDGEIVGLLNERAAWELARLRGTVDSGAADEWRTQEEARWLAASSGPLPASSLQAILRELRSGCQALLCPVRVAYLGPAYSYSHQAAVERYGTSAQLAAVTTIAGVFDEIRAGHADFGLVPIENSTDGRIVDTLGMFARYPVRICGEVQLRIHHQLLARCERQAIREVYSKPQAVSQCRVWIARHLPDARIVEMTSTAAAAQLAAEKSGVAAIASQQAAVNYGLNIVAANIEDNPDNLTRFAVIGGEPPEPSGNDKTALMFELAHRPGSLADAMTVFKSQGLNLTWIESFPMPGTSKEYLFFVELEGHARDAKVAKALAALRKRTVRLEVLGSYPKAAPIR